MEILCHEILVHVAIDKIKSLKNDFNVQYLKHDVVILIPPQNPHDSNPTFHTDQCTLAPEELKGMNHIVMVMNGCHVIKRFPRDPLIERR